VLIFTKAKGNNSVTSSTIKSLNKMTNGNEVKLRVR